MSIALLLLRLEVSDKSDGPSGFDFLADGFKDSDGQAVSLKSNYSDNNSIPPTPEYQGEVTIEDNRGERKLHEIVLETYTAENFKMAEGSSRPSHQQRTEGSLSPSLHPEGGAEKTGDSVWERRRKSREGSASSSSTDSSTLSKKSGVFKTIETEERAVLDRESQPRDRRPKSQSPTLGDTQSIHFYSGNPSVEKVEGILHIYKDNHMTTLAEGKRRSELICMLAVPAKLTIHDLLKFNGPCLKGIEFMRIIRDASPNQYMVLVKFHSQDLANEYYSTFNNTVYNSIESDVCHLVYVGKLEALKESENACFPIPGVTELPNCPVCLERMDESVDGILTILCNHAFHISCLDQWGDTSCPVCRYCQTPEEVPDSRCMKCGSQESLWICLICGNIGCGRYVELHAYRHFQETQHTYAMELGSNKVWDYIGDNYVHRLVQNKADGKLVQVEDVANQVHSEKMDSLNLEYTYLLTNQLESQRLYFEEKMGEMENIAVEKMQSLEKENEDLRHKCHSLEERLNEALKESHNWEKKTSHLHQRMKKVFQELQEEKEMNHSLRENQVEWQRQVTKLEQQLKESNATKDKEIQDLKDQVRDVMFYVEACKKLSTATDVTQEELQQGQVVVGAAATATAPQSRKSRKKTR